jgi:hypothetical protein
MPFKILWLKHTTPVGIVFVFSSLSLFLFYVKKRPVFHNFDGRFFDISKIMFLEEK